MTLEAAPHLWPGELPTAFVFSVPGRHEKCKGRPVAGGTGTNLTAALAILHAARPDRFASPTLEAYRITNAYHEPIWPKNNNGRSEAMASQLKTPNNKGRLVDELADCRLIVWCGKKAQYLQRFLIDELPDRVHIAVPHLSAFGLMSLKVPEGSTILTKAAVYKHRIGLWTTQVLEQCDGRLS